MQGPETKTPRAGTWYDARKAVPPVMEPVLVAYVYYGGGLHPKGDRAAVWDGSRWKWAEYASFDGGYVVPPAKILAWTGCPEAPAELLKQ